MSPVGKIIANVVNKCFKRVTNHTNSKITNSLGFGENKERYEIVFVQLDNRYIYIFMSFHASYATFYKRTFLHLFVIFMRAYFVMP